MSPSAIQKLYGGWLPGFKYTGTAIKPGIGLEDLKVIWTEL
jgi:hypothetical protein